MAQCRFAREFYNGSHGRIRSTRTAYPSAPVIANTAFWKRETVPALSTNFAVRPKKSITTGSDHQRDHSGSTFKKKGRLTGRADNIEKHCQPFPSAFMV